MSRKAQEVEEWPGADTPSKYEVEMAMIKVLGTKPSKSAKPLPRRDSAGYKMP